MKKVSGSADVKLLEQVNAVKDLWRIRWNVSTDGESITYYEEEVSGKPSFDKVKEIISEQVNELVKAKILSGMVYDGSVVWLSSENQMNYKRAYDFAVQTGGSIMPVTIKLGNEDKIEYYTFKTLDEFTDFSKKVYEHIENAIVEGWKMKDDIKAEDYS